MYESTGGGIFSGIGDVISWEVECWYNSLKFDGNSPQILLKINVWKALAVPNKNWHY